MPDWLWLAAFPTPPLVVPAAGLRAPPPTVAPPCTCWNGHASPLKHPRCVLKNLQGPRPRLLPRAAPPRPRPRPRLAAAIEPCAALGLATTPAPPCLSCFRTALLPARPRLAGSAGAPCTPAPPRCAGGAGAPAARREAGAATKRSACVADATIRTSLAGGAPPAPGTSVTLRRRTRLRLAGPSASTCVAAGSAVSPEPSPDDRRGLPRLRRPVPPAFRA